MLLIGNGTLLTRGEEARVIENGCVACENDCIVAVGDTNALRKKYPDAEWLDAAGGLIMPGLINAHGHIYSALSRGLAIKGYAP